MLGEDNSGTLQARFERVLTAFVDEIEELTIEDPANPTGNDLSFALTDNLRDRLRSVAKDTLDTAEEYGWEHVFGKIEKAAAALPRVAVLTTAAAAIGAAAPPWADEV